MASIRRLFATSKLKKTSQIRRRLRLQPLEDRIAPAFSEFVDPHPYFENGFGQTVVPLSTGNVVVTSPYDDAGGTDAGAVYLFNGSTGALISTLIGSHPNDNLGSRSVTALTNGNFVVRSPSWDNDSVVDAGAVTWGNGTTGISGIVTAANSLVGSSANDSIGYNGVTALANGNYVVDGGSWDNGAVVNVGAVTWGNGTTGVSGPINSGNSLIGSSPNDAVSGIQALSNGNYLVCSPDWNNGFITDAGAVTWGNGTTGISGVVSAANSLVGSHSYDKVGVSQGVSNANCIRFLSNGNYLVVDFSWRNGAASSAGSVTWCSGTSGTVGVISPTNSLVGSSAGDSIGYDVILLASGNYVVRSPNWDNGAIQNVGAVTWCNGAVGLSGSVSAANSLIGGHASDGVGIGVTELTNGNYVVRSALWDNGAVQNVGAVTWCNGNSGTTGTINSTNSLVGSQFQDQIGTTVTALSNGNYVVGSPGWDNGAIQNAGAVTWCNGTQSTADVVSTVNSLVGTHTSDVVGSVTALPNGNYVVSSREWDNGVIPNTGAVTWCTGVQSTAEPVSTSNSLVGGQANDSVGYRGATILTNGNYIIGSPNWHNGSIADAGAATWCSGTQNTTGVVGPSNSLVGTTASDRVGDSYAVTPLTNGNYVVTSPNWDNGTSKDAGAATWGNGATGISGVITSSNSLVGASADDSVGFGQVTPLANGNYVVGSPYWDNGTTVNVGAVTWGDGTTGTSGIVSGANSLVGNVTYDRVGVNGIFALSNGNYLVETMEWHSGATSDVGAVTFGNGATGISGLINPSNSAIGSMNGSMGTTVKLVLDNLSGSFYQSFPRDGTGGRVRVGSQTTGMSTPPPVVNSVVFGDGTNQRSLVKQIVVNFSEFVNFMGGMNNAFTLRRTGSGGPVGDVTLTAEGDFITDVATSVTLTFSGSLTEFDSLIDGTYDLIISAAQVSGIAGALDGNGDGIAGGSYAVVGNTANHFHRLFGDSNGNGTVDQEVDFSAFKSAYGFSSSIFDFNNNGVVDQTVDFVRFKNNFGMTP